jgi:Bifunctional DNA primase/polymerase, N-terminal
VSRRQRHGATDLGAAALAYAAQGFRVLPLHHPVRASDEEAGGVGCSCGQRSCSSIGKHPLTPHGLIDATRDPAQLGWWWRRWPNANIGLLTAS